MEANFYAFLKLALDEDDGKLYAPIALPPVKVESITTGKRFVGPQDLSGCCRVEKNLLPLRRIEIISSVSSP
jgi:hypothetical protein